MILRVCLAVNGSVCAFETLKSFPLSVSIRVSMSKSVGD